MTPAKLQPEFDYKTDERDWSAVKLLMEELEQELAERRSHLLFRISGWYFGLKVFKRVESEKLVLKKPLERDTRYHRSIVAFLRGCGEMLLVEWATHQEIASEIAGISYADFAASVEELKLAEREWYGDMTDSRRTEILNNVFGST